MANQTDPRRRYLEIATHRFAERGFHGVTLAALADDAGVTKQALLYFFPTKERLYGEVLARLAERLSSKIDDIDAPTPEQRPVTYFEAHTNGALSRPDDARLVIRVLLDTDAATKVSPLKPYLEKLVAVTRETNRWKDVSREEVLAGLYKLIGAIQYFAISTPALRGMYGTTTKESLATHFSEQSKAAIRDFVDCS